VCIQELRSNGLVKKINGEARELRLERERVEEEKRAAPEAEEKPQKKKDRRENAYGTRPKNKDVKNE
jgi:hypothetical protein